MKVSAGINEYKQYSVEKNLQEMLNQKETNILGNIELEKKTVKKADDKEARAKELQEKEMQEKEMKEKEKAANKEVEKAANLRISEEARKMWQEQAEAANEAGDAFADMAKMMEIARRIARGDRVPPKDEKKLMEFSDELYQASKAAAMVAKNRNPKKHKTLFPDEEENAENKLNEEENDVMETVETAAVEETGNVTGEMSVEVSVELQ